MIRDSPIIKQQKNLKAFCLWILNLLQLSFYYKYFQFAQRKIRFNAPHSITFFDIE